MKRLLLSLSFLSASLIAGPDCIDNSEHLTKAYDDKEWHSVDCACNCTTIKGGHCADCNHLQNARPLTIITPTKTQTTVSSSKIYTPDNPQNALKKLAARYVKNKYDI